MLTKDHIIHILHGNADAAAWADAAMEILPKYEINTPNRIAGFFAQCGHESMNFTVLSENLNYRAETLEKLFSKYFSKAGRNAADYAKQPEKIANVIYANRMGNGDTASGEGFKFRGRGIVQLTGKDNYSAFALSIKMTLPDVIEYVQTKKGALESACWYWNSRNINAACDANDITKMSKPRGPPEALHRSLGCSWWRCASTDHTRICHSRRVEERLNRREREAYASGAWLGS